MSWDGVRVEDPVKIILKRSDLPDEVFKHFVRLGCVTLSYEFRNATYSYNPYWFFMPDWLYKSRA
jgi:hypothetical protein